MPQESYHAFLNIAGKNNQENYSGYEWNIYDIRKRIFQGSCNYRLDHDIRDFPFTNRQLNFDDLRFEI
jgi:hypothetical protein